MIEADVGGDDARDARQHTLIRELEAVLGRRVDDLERDNDRLRRRSTMLALGVAASLTLAAGTLLYGLTAEHRVAGAVHAHQFVLHDADGNVRGGLGLTPEGGSRLVLKDRAGTERLKFTLLADGSPGLSFADVDGRSRVVLGFLPDETANLVFADRFGRTRAVFGLMPDESSTLVFADHNGETRLGLGIDTRGGAGLTVFERDNERVHAPAELTAEAADTLRGAEPGGPGAARR